MNCQKNRPWEIVGWLRQARVRCTSEYTERHATDEITVNGLQKKQHGGGAAKQNACAALSARGYISSDRRQRTQRIQQRP